MNHIFSLTFNLPVVFTMMGIRAANSVAVLSALISPRVDSRDMLSLRQLNWFGDMSRRLNLLPSYSRSFNHNYFPGRPLGKTSGSAYLAGYNVIPLYVFGYSVYLKCPENIRQISIRLPFPSHP
ncbi:uncharacterized protein BKA55DRAFT_243173 [Fusarium redolens]|uniref:Uncharacterized protein n=1 Tax=Fusarium redolens TaxID=48865 RepID=A0A9P9KJG5_FUSRE|nr:uncharacterized protein BKA55DRAFT_243173 [Fusarium redolens]KAH7265257.1 hypothetical protein BKA55DRAFT_243173 [Fusarium redolens]